jgi:hypothetical protein
MKHVIYTVSNTNVKNSVHFSLSCTCIEICSHLKSKFAKLFTF